MQKKNKKIIKSTIAIVIIILILLLLIILTNILNKQNKLALYENTPTMLVSSNPNPPKLSAGMIPIKWNGENFVITTKNDAEWYNSKPTYVMLNDGYYKSELERGVKEEQLMQNNVGVGVPDDPSIRGTIFMWIPRFVYNEAGEIGYIKEETTPGDGWTVPDLFMYKTADETKPDFSLSGVWLQKDVDTAYSTKIAQMNQEESIYGFIANTKAIQINSNDINAIQKYVDILPPLSKEGGTIVPEGSVLTDSTNQNRIILKIINNNQYEPIKANVIHNTVNKRIEIRVTYTANGISSILDEYGNTMTLTEENGIILADTGNVGLAKGTYYFTVIDNKGNKQELSIEPTINSLFKVAYINGIDNMDNTATYNKSKETVSSTETTLLNQIKAQDTTKTYSRAIQDTNGLTTAVSQRDRTSGDETLDLVKLYDIKYPCSVSSDYYTTLSKISWYRTGYTGYSINSGNSVTFRGKESTYASDGDTYYYYTSNLPYSSVSDNQKTYNISTFYKFICTGHSNRYKTADYSVYKMTIRQTSNTPSKGNFNQTSVVRSDAYTNNAYNVPYWYEKVEIIPKYTLCKYDQNLALQSTYDVDTDTLTTVPIDISNKGRNKLKLTLIVSGTGYKTYISNDKTNWKEVTDITSGTPKELEVEGWDNLYVKIETNACRIDNIDIAYYKD